MAIKNADFIEGQVFTIKDIFFEWINILFLGGGVPLQGTLWFVPMLLLCTGMFCAVIYWQKKIPLINNNIVLLATCFIIGIGGIWITNRGTDLKYFLNISMIMLPVCAFGHICRKKYRDISNLLIIPLGLIGGVANFLFAYVLNWDINLASNNTAGYKFYIVTLVGIYMALTLAKVLECFKITRIIFSFLGKYSFEIMAFHFSVFKIIDSIYGKLFPDRIPADILRVFPTAGTVNAVIYIILGCAAPALAGHFISHIGKIKKVSEKQHG